MKISAFKQLPTSHSGVISRLIGLSFLCLVFAIAYLHFSQQKDVSNTMKRLIDLENARTDLAKGFLFSVADKTEDGPFHHGQGMVLLLQAQQTLVQSKREPTPSAAQTSIQLNNGFNAFLAAIKDWQATSSPSANAAIKLRVHFQKVDILASELEAKARQELTMRHAEYSRQFTWVLGMGLLTIIALELLLWASEKAKKKAQEEASLAEKRLSLILDNVSVNIYIKDTDLRYQYVNQHVASLFNIPADALIGQKDEALFDEETVNRLNKTDKEILVTGTKQALEERSINQATGEERIYFSTKVPLFDDHGNIYGICGLSTDITDIKKEQERKLEHEQLLHNMSRIAQVGGWGFDVATGVGQWTDEVARIHDMEPQEFVTLAQGLAVYQGESRTKIEVALKEAIELAKPYDLELQILTAKHRHKWVRTVGHPITKDGKVTRVIGAFQDITQAKETLNLIWKQANIDLLTGLPNRRKLIDDLKGLIEKSSRQYAPFAFMLLDLDRFKEINDTMGHDYGDELLKQSAQRVKDCVRDSDIVARLGGDEFIIVLTDLSDKNITNRIAENIQKNFSNMFELAGKPAYISVSIGITMFPEDGDCVEDLLKNADQAMYTAKSLGRKRHMYFSPAMQQASEARMEISTDLRSALSQHQLQVYYQPIVALENGRIYKAEALLRWRHPQKGMISPADFIPIAEENGEIIPIGNWVFEQVAAQISQWRAALSPDMQVAINKSPIQFLNDSTLDQGWLSLMNRLHLPKHSIVVEITEGILLNKLPMVDEKLLKFKEAGMEVALDDFGTGYSSLAYLKKFDIDYIKIDQSFVANLAKDSEDLALCEAIIVMAHKLGMKVIAEGVETQQQYDLLKAAHCDFGQGYFWSPPVPAISLEALLVENAEQQSHNKSLKP